MRFSLFYSFHLIDVIETEVMKTEILNQYSDSNFGFSTIQIANENIHDISAKKEKSIRFIRILFMDDKIGNRLPFGFFSFVSFSFGCVT